jgi:hypothetical protein
MRERPLSGLLIDRAPRVVAAAPEGMICDAGTRL